MSNLTIANIFLFFAILCLAISAEIGWPLYFIYSMVAVALAGAVRHGQLPEHPPRAQKPRH
jgi:hypothetical protein